MWHCSYIRVFLAGKEVFIEGGNTKDTCLRTDTEADEEAFTRGLRQNPTRLETTYHQTRPTWGERTKQQKGERKKEGPCFL